MEAVLNPVAITFGNLLTIGGVLLTVGGFWAVTNQRLKALEREVRQLVEVITVQAKHDERITANDRRISRLEARLDGAKPNI